jgi:hypothetical protein
MTIESVTPAAAPILVTQDAIDALHKESQFWCMASEFMLESGLWKVKEER